MRALLAGSLLLGLGAWAPAVRPPAPTGLMCELTARTAAIAVRDPRPDFSWIVNSHETNDFQTAYQLRVGQGAGMPTCDERAAPPAEDEPAGPGGSFLVWDSGRIRSADSTAVEYSGPPLEPYTAYSWAVRTWDRRGRPSGWSAPQEFRTGHLSRRPPGAEAATADDRFTVSRCPVEQAPEHPVRVVPLGEGRTFLDFGRAAFGRLKLDLPGAAGRIPVVVYLGETVDAAGRLNRRPGASIRALRAEIPLRPGVSDYEVPLPDRDRRLLPAAVGAAMPFRYVEIEDAPQPVGRESATRIAVHYPFDDRAAAFRCSDPRLNDVWELCRYSIKATSPFGVYVDGDRERKPYEADAYINQLGHYCADREYTLARYSHEYLILHPTWPTEWILHSVLMAWADYLYTGDRDSLREFYADLRAKTLRSLAGPEGLISTVSPAPGPETLRSIHFEGTLRDIVDWPAGERDGYDMRPVSTVVNAFHQRALALMAKIAAALDRRDDARAFADGAARAARAINERLVDPATGLYVDGVGSSHASLHANMLPLAFGIVPPDRLAAVTAFVRSRGMACSVYGAQYLLEALYSAGEGEAARALMTAPGDRSWAHMIYDLGSTISLEAWDNRYKPNQDWTHAWGAAPANIIPRRLMGVEPLEPGFRKVRIRPQPGSLTWASLRLPTVRGTIHVDVRCREDTFDLTVRLPANMTAEVSLPAAGSGPDRVEVDGRLRRPQAVSGRWLVIDGVGSGTHHFRRRAAAARPGRAS